MLNSRLPIGEMKNGTEEVWAEIVLFLFCRSVKAEGDGEEFLFVEYMEFVTFLDEMNEALKCVSAVSGFGFWEGVK